MQALSTEHASFFLSFLLHIHHHNEKMICQHCCRASNGSGGKLGGENGYFICTYVIVSLSCCCCHCFSFLCSHGNISFILLVYLWIWCCYCLRIELPFRSLWANPPILHIFLSSLLCNVSMKVSFNRPLLLNSGLILLKTEAGNISHFSLQDETITQATAVLFLLEVLQHNTRSVQAWISKKRGSG